MPSLPDHPEQPVRFTGKVSDKIFSQYVSLRESLDSLVFTTTKQKYIDKGMDANTAATSAMLEFKGELARGQ